MRIKLYLVALITLTLTLFTSVATAATSAKAEAASKFSMEPTTNNGQRWRIGYYEGGEYPDYQRELIVTVRSLMDMGWIKKADIPPQKGDQTSDLWRWLSESAQSDYIEFVKNAHYNANWDDNLRAQMKKDIIKRLSEKKDIDLMIAMGTWAGLDLANNEHSTPTLVFSASDPLSAGIIKSIDDSGYDHLHATMDPFRYDRHIRVFHDIAGFKKLGIAYENTQNGRSYAAVDTIEALSKELKFTIVPCYTKSDIADVSMAEHSVIDCFQKLAPKVDAIYITEQGGVTRKTLPVIVKTAQKYNVPTFSQSGSEEVRYGVLASLSQFNFKYFGEFHAQTMARIFNGAKPNELPQLFEEPARMALNLKTAEIIGFNPSLLLLGASDEIYREVETPQ
ncbi:ABC transporter substrate-binding protein [Hahella sp. KA22]|uniref:ABC transporter substrate-binding protein n=1 Tax=Hahella sp. KA22 TaxID=1628392 RepID=UPI000FDD97DE|nr:ABC transporter substrate binding protein [Hahella sp. KA22]AZZ92258.1 ABC transporter substrate-binding protein [Hahella sp. KA22]QAY55629.1 ABC transporter substrate-binding protein [Hahella sp. KA22]